VSPIAGERQGPSFAAPLFSGSAVENCTDGTWLPPQRLYALTGGWAKSQIRRWSRPRPPWRPARQLGRCAV